ncbi:hypothetical protein LCGC14_1893180 [marine sediment metagenome]|uniref:Uncharacterized protein n=1 Tax=marine sediment metagenome TaxID=412755 RepID=A0A0F9GM46_9ZZZZ
MTRKRVTKKIEAEDVTCDVCGVDAKETKWSIPSRCRICERDLCQKCEVFDDREHGDHPYRFCRRCWDIGKQYREKQRILQLRCDGSVCREQKEWEAAVRQEQTAPADAGEHS